MCLFMPGKLASVLTGVMVGMTIVDADPQPCATRIAMIRMPGVDVPRLKSSNRYVDLANESLSSDLAALGLRAAELSALDALLAEFLEGDRARAHLHVGSHEHAKLTHALDRLLLQSARTSHVLA